MKRAVILYWSNTGNTEKVAFAIKKGLEDAGVDASVMKATEAENIDYFDYDLVCVGSPSIQWHPPPQITELLLKKFSEYKKQEKIKTGAPKVAGKNALIFCTYSGPHTGLREATPVGLYIGQFFEHIGFTVLDEIKFWYFDGLTTVISFLIVLFGFCVGILMMIVYAGFLVNHTSMNKLFAIGDDV